MVDEMENRHLKKDDLVSWPIENVIDYDGPGSAFERALENEKIVCNCKKGCGTQRKGRQCVCKKAGIKCKALCHPELNCRNEKD